MNQFRMGSYDHRTSKVSRLCIGALPADASLGLHSLSNTVQLILARQRPLSILLLTPYIPKNRTIY
jgi:hypothetical protein